MLSPDPLPSVSVSPANGGSMLLIPTKALRAGMTLAQPILHPLCESCVLLTKGAKLDEKYIQRLHKVGLDHVWVDFPGLEELDGSINEKISAAHLRLYQAMNDSIDRLERRVEVKLNLHQYRKTVQAMLSHIVEDPDHDVMSHQLASCGAVLTGHLANCSYLALLVGAHMTGYLRHQRSTLPPEVAANTSELGVGALLHDIGKLAMPEDMEAKGILDPEADLPEYRYHSYAGFQEAREHVSVVAASVILNHHQRFDGQGFPPRPSRDPNKVNEPLAGKNIHIFARIVAVIDAFDHLLCQGGHMVPTIQAIVGLRSPRFSGWFDPVVVETLLRLIPAFQIGSTVTLSNGTYAVVVRNHPEAPCRPMIRPLTGPVTDSKTRTTRRQLDLRMCPKITIASVGNVDVRPYLFRGELEPV